MAAQIDFRGLVQVGASRRLSAVLGTLCNLWGEVGLRVAGLPVVVGDQLGSIEVGFIPGLGVEKSHGVEDQSAVHGKGGTTLGKIVAVVFAGLLVIDVPLPDTL